jgi:uncharacterized protein YheU (UPF0270 family)
MDGERGADDAERRIEVPPGALAPGVLRRLIEEFVTRDGTDYGAVERTLGEKVAAVMRQLAAGEAAILVDPERETVDIVARERGGR